MRRFWAPWRLEYVQGEKDNECFLCRIAEETDDRANGLVKRGRCCAVVLNRYPYNNGHLMVFPYRHVAGIDSMNRDERIETMDLVAETIAALREAIAPHGFNVGINLGRVAGAGLEEHIHTHVVPRWNGDTNFMPVLGEVKVIPQSLSDLWDALYPLLNPRKKGDEQ